MSDLLHHLWRARSRAPVGSYPWFRAWAKRVRLAYELYRQQRIQSVLRRRGAQIGNGIHLSSMKQISGNLNQLSIGDESAIGRVHIALNDAVRIGSRVCINDGVRLLTASHVVNSTDWQLKSSPIRIEDYAWIAMDAIILPGVTIERGAVVGAGAVVSKRVPAGSTVAGNPAIVVSTQRPSQLDYSPAHRNALFDAWLSGSQTTINAAHKAAHEPAARDALVRPEAR